MKIFLSLVFLFFAAPIAWAQNEEMKQTHEQRVVDESNRKSKAGKKKLSLRKKIHISKGQDKKARRVSAPKQKPRKRK